MFCRNIDEFSGDSEPDMAPQRHAGDKISVMKCKKLALEQFKIMLSSFQKPDKLVYKNVVQILVWVAPYTKTQLTKIVLQPARINLHNIFDRVFLKDDYIILIKKEDSNTYVVCVCIGTKKCSESWSIFCRNIAEFSSDS